MTLPEQNEIIAARRAGEAQTSGPNGGHWSAVVGNERLTGLAGAVLLVLIAVELATVPTLGALLSTHVVVGVLLAGPLLVKLGSTGYRFVRYYTGSPAYVRKGPPHLPLRLLAPLLVVTTLVVIGSGIGLVATGPTQAGSLPDFKGICLAVIPTGGPRRPRPFRRCGACATKPWPCTRQLSAVAEQLTIGKLVEAIGLDLARHSRS